MEQITRISLDLGHSVINIIEDRSGFSVSLRLQTGPVAVVRIVYGLSDAEIRQRLTL